MYCTVIFLRLVGRLVTCCSTDEIISSSNPLGKLSFGHCFNRPIDNIVFPKGLKLVTFGKFFNQSFRSLPGGIENIYIANLNNIYEIPTSTQNVCYVHDGSTSIDIFNVLPCTITEITITRDISTDEVTVLTRLPESIKKIRLEFDYTEFIKKLIKVNPGCIVVDRDDNIIHSL
ncbi:MAG: hypothetical protein Gaeavirus14_6 [Gaeavirus sp.]|uniref:F-box and FNIP repeat-containing protein n=1 Tax=Gaeavirus sp. TaxID=2487767 RepID=A0A3G4ZZ03_9VIRU|nr:MAG: hypothetical protein Gaeavirus14_6 [Gaeavirus sp.]